MKTASSPSLTATSCRVATEPAELSEHYALRRRVFVVEQGIFERDDRDGRDDDERTLHVVGIVDAQPLLILNTCPTSFPAALTLQTLLCYRRAVKGNFHAT